ncbi:hypothetical protein ABZV31_19025 [Streptomyces sp. NPDC005202]|uniref:hypothetical protein n=1 Tax=Streptomyces sp. NPDC005202 TaxID=3157021 RepID=UPI0033AD2616
MSAGDAKRLGDAAKETLSKVNPAAPGIMTTPTAPVTPATSPAPAKPATPAAPVTLPALVVSASTLPAPVVSASTLPAPVSLTKNADDSKATALTSDVLAALDKAVDNLLQAVTSGDVSHVTRRSRAC